MTHHASDDPVYALGDSDIAIQRLIDQAHMINPYTRALLTEAGVGPGMRILDVGCGVGDVSLLAAERVGPAGQVVGVDTSDRQLEVARRRAAQAGAAHVRFVHGDIREFVAVQPFDVAIGRLILMWVGDPAAVVRHVAEQVRPGGVVAFQEYHMDYTPLATGSNVAYEQARQWILSTARRMGVHVDMGLRLHHAFMSAGLAAPHLHMDVRVVAPGDQLCGRVTAGTLTTILPFLEQYGIATTEEVHVETYPERHTQEVVHSDVVHTYTPLVRAWTRTSAN